MSTPAEKTVRNWLATRFPAARVVTETPDNLADVLPCICVTRFGGSSQYPTLDAANIDVDYYESDRDLARDGAEQVRRAIEVEMPGSVLGGNTITGTEEVSAPKWTPYANTNVRLFSGAYQITLHTD